MKVYVIHENDAWVEPLRAAFAELGTPFAEWFLDRGIVDLRVPPPAGVFYNRMSASSHTRDHRYAAEYAGAVLAWLERRPALRAPAGPEEGACPAAAGGAEAGAPGVPGAGALWTTGECGSRRIRADCRAKHARRRFEPIRRCQAMVVP
jgi:hypothetical protein